MNMDRHVQTERSEVKGDTSRIHKDGEVREKEKEKQDKELEKKHQVIYQKQHNNRRKCKYYHGCPADHDEADHYYYRPCRPHYWPSGTGSGDWIEPPHMTRKQVEEYTLGTHKQNAKTMETGHFIKIIHNATIVMHFIPTQMQMNTPMRMDLKNGMMVVVNLVYLNLESKHVRVCKIE